MCGMRIIGRYELDLKIIGMTVMKVLKREGISQDGHATVQEFLGSHAKAQRREER